MRVTKEEMHRRIILLCVIFYDISCNEYFVDTNTNPGHLAEMACEGKRITCHNLVRPLAEMYSIKNYGNKFEGWRESSICR